MAELIERGFEVIAFEQLSEAVAVLRRSILARPTAIVFELRSQYIDPRLLHEMAESQIPVLLLKGVFEERESTIEDYHWTAVMQRPFTIGAVADKVQEIAQKSLV